MGSNPPVSGVVSRKLILAAGSIQSSLWRGLAKFFDFDRIQWLQYAVMRRSSAAPGQWQLTLFNKNVLFQSNCMVWFGLVSRNSMTYLTCCHALPVMWSLHWLASFSYHYHNSSTRSGSFYDVNFCIDIINFQLSKMTLSILLVLPTW